MLPLSHKPEVLRLHELQSKERLKFTQSFVLALAETLPSSANKYLKQSKLLSQIVTALPDAYYSIVTLLLCRRRLGEEYTYIAMYKQKHYLEQGVLLNKKTRVLLFLLELLSRNLLLPLFSKLTTGQRRAFEENKPGPQKPPPLALMQGVISSWERARVGLVRVLGSAQEIMSNVEWLILMVYMLDWNKHFTFIETLLGISYAYTYKNDQIRDVSYKVEGYLLLATFAVKIGKSLYALMTRRQAGKDEEAKGREMVKEKQGSDASNGKEKGLCRICYDQLRDKSATKCGHTFCWSCIVKTLEMSEECPVCRTHCLPREVVQLRNFA